jgi:BolA protein
MTDDMTQHTMSAQDVQSLVAAALPGALVDVRDDTHKHLTHNAMVDHFGGHYKIRVVWEGFAGMARIARHRMVQNILGEAWTAGHVHSLSLRLMTREEAGDVA